jgi:hypothetical protein
VTVVLQISAVRQSVRARRGSTLLGFIGLSGSSAGLLYAPTTLGYDTEKGTFALALVHNCKTQHRGSRFGISTAVVHQGFALYWHTLIRCLSNVCYVYLGIELRLELQWMLHAEVFCKCTRELSSPSPVYKL